jgi:hypothetical protein
MKASATLHNQIECFLRLVDAGAVVRATTQEDAKAIVARSNEAMRTAMTGAAIAAMEAAVADGFPPEVAVCNALPPAVAALWVSGVVGMMEFPEAFLSVEAMKLLDFLVEESLP